MQPTSPWRTITLAGVLVVIVLVLGVYIYFVFFAVNGGGGGRRAVNTSVEYALRGDYKAAREQATEVLAKLDPESRYYDDAKWVYELSTFWDASADTRLEAVRLAKQSYLDSEGNPYEQAMAANRLLSYAKSTTYDPVIGKEIFAGPPFEVFVATGTKGNPYKKLAEHSVSLYPTSDALFTIGMWHLGQIVKHVDGVKKISAKKLDGRVSSIVGIITQADELFPVEERGARNGLFGIEYKPSFFFAEGQLYGVLSLVDPSYLEKSETAFKRVVDNSGDPTVPQLRLPNAHLNMAMLINEVAGTKRSADVRTHLDEVVRVVRANPDVHVRGFSAYMQALNSYASTSSGLISHARVAKLADLHTGFRTLLEERGWKF